jgi:hypothetical protein
VTPSTVAEGSRASSVGPNAWVNRPLGSGEVKASEATEAETEPAAVAVVPVLLLLTDMVSSTPANGEPLMSASVATRDLPLLAQFGSTPRMSESSWEMREMQFA